jgi:hypothetical protein
VERIDLIGDLAIKQGKSYRCTILWPGDVSAGTPRAIARWDYKDTGVPPEFEFSFLPLTFPVLNSKDEQCTGITLYLTAEQTSGIEKTKYQGESGQTLKPGNAYVFDVEIEMPDGSVEAIDAGFIQVKREVT